MSWNKLRSKKVRLALALALLACVLIVAGVAAAVNGGGYELSWNVIASGGQVSTGDLALPAAGAPPGCSLTG